MKSLIQIVHRVGQVCISTIINVFFNAQLIIMEIMMMRPAIIANCHANNVTVNIYAKLAQLGYFIIKYVFLIALKVPFLILH